MAKESNWSASETRALRPYVRKLAEGKYRDASEAARAYLAETASQSGTKRSIKAVQTRIIDEARAQGLSWRGVDWGESELRAIRRYARAAVAGRFPSVMDAAKACLREFGRLSGTRHTDNPGRGALGPRRSLKGLHDRMLMEAHTLGWPRAFGPWTVAEEAVFKRHLNGLLTGSYQCVHEAAHVCACELAELSKRRPAVVHPRSVVSLLSRLQQEAKRTAVPRFRSHMTEKEDGLVEQYARAVDRGEYDSWKAAAKACRDEMMGLSLTAVRRRGLCTRGIAGHSLHTIHTRMLDISRSLMLRGPRRVLWTEPELRRCASWVRWFDRHRAGRRRMRIFSEAAVGLQEELDVLGSSRTLGACRRRLYKSWCETRGW